MAHQFVRFVSSVPGRLVTRWDNPSASFGARVTTLDERKAGAAPIIWDPDVVIPLTAEFCARFERELRDALRNGDLVERMEADWQRWLQLEQEREAERAKRLTEPDSAKKKKGT